MREREISKPLELEARESPYEGMGQPPLPDGQFRHPRRCAGSRCGKGNVLHHELVPPHEGCVVVLADMASVPDLPFIKFVLVHGSSGV